MTWLGDFPEDFTTVTCMFTTHASTGAPVAPLSAFEAADVVIFKNGSATEKTTTNGVTMTSPFNGTTGLHCVTIDTSNDTGDGGFWVAGAVYTLALVPDETVDSVAVAKVIGQFGIELSNVLRPTTAGRKLDVSAGGEAGVDWANIGSPTTSVNLSGTTVKTATDVETKVDTIDGIVDAILVDTGTTLDGKIDTIDTVVDAIKLRTDNLPTDPADQSLIIAATDALATLIGDVPTNSELATALASADDAVLAAISGLTIPTAAQNAAGLLDLTDGVESGLTLREWLRLGGSVLFSKASGLDTTSAVYRDFGDTKDRITATVDTDGNRTAITRDAT